MEMKMCECEHTSHFWGKGEPRVYSPNGNPNHRSGIKYAETYLVDVQTPMGTFKVCKDCAKDCYHPDNFPKEG